MHESLPARVNEAAQTPHEGSIAADVLEPIAVIGVSLKFPQDAISPDSFWQLLMEGRSALTEIPKDRFNIDAFYHSDPTRPNALNMRGGHFVKDDLAAFDAPFFSINPAEASCIDPQQRGLLECTYRALENAGVTLADVADSRTSVHIGTFCREYETILLRDPDLQAQYMATGTGTAMLANRLSWFFNLKGPSIAVDTACSSSMLALHLACQSMRSGESSMGLVAGCNLLYNPDLMVPLTNLGFLSADSKCYSFDHRANGYSRGEGFGVVVIKPLFKALQEGNTIRAVIRATGTNQDGRTPGITQPSSLAQERLIRETYETGGLSLRETGFFEAHGTGTPIGDPLEANAIGAVFGNERSRDDPIFVGAVKSNIGHLEGASGIAGLIKSILVLEKGVIPPNIWFQQLNPKIVSKDLNIKFPLEPTLWPSNGLRRASVNSFGFGGSNVHVVLDDARNYLKLRNLSGNHRTVEIPHESRPISPRHENPQDYPALGSSQNLQIPRTPVSKLLVWSSSDKDGLKRLADVYHEYLTGLLTPVREDDPIYFKDLVYTMCAKRSSLPWKCFTLSSSALDLRQRLSTFADDPVRSKHFPKVAFVFTGQGAQWCGMGRQLLLYAKFRQSLQNADAFLKSLGCQWSLLDIFSKSEEISINDDPAVSQPLCTALQMALVDLLLSWHIYPCAVVGHSSGEIAAAYCKGALTPESAWRIAYQRGIVSAQAVVRAQKRGSMMAVGLSRAKILPYLSTPKAEERRDDVAIGCINSPESVTLTGVEEQLETLRTRLEQDGVFTRKLKVNVAYHSFYMNEVAEDYKKCIRDISPKESHGLTPSMAMYSTVSGKIVDTEQLQEVEYWVRNLTSPTQFLDAITSMLSKTPQKREHNSDSDWKHSSAIDHIVEIGPHATLQGPLKDILRSLDKHETIGYSSILRRGVCGLETSLTVAGRLHCLGYSVNLLEVNRLTDSHLLVDLPQYPFNHSQKYWLESRISRDFRFRQNPPHDLLGTTARDWSPLEPTWRHFISERENPWIKDHAVNGMIIYPASGMLVMAIEALRQFEGARNSVKSYRLKEVVFVTAIQIAESLEGTETRFSLRPSVTENNGIVWYQFHLSTYAHDTWVENCRGLIQLEHGGGLNEENGIKHSHGLHSGRLDFINGRARCSIPVNKSYLYGKLNSLGYGFGPCFQTLSNVCYNDQGEAAATIRPREWMMKFPKQRASEHVIHPTALDGILQTIFAGLSKGGRDRIPTLVPTKINSIWVSNSLLNNYEASEIRIFSKSAQTGSRVADSTIIAVNDVDSEAQVVIEGLQTTAVAETSKSSSSVNYGSNLCYNLEHQPDFSLLTGQEIFEQCMKSSQDSEAGYDEAVQDAELLCLISIKDTLQNISPDIELCLKPHLTKYLNWMKHQVKILDCGLLEQDRSSRDDHVVDVESHAALFERVEKSNPEGKLCVVVARKLIPILTGKIDALELLFSSRLVDEYYDWSLNYANGFGQISKYLDALVHKHPNLNILEIGAGTGSGTEPTIDVLKRHGEGEHGTARYGHFTFTDISPSFFEKAKIRFAGETNRMTFKVLDISSDPVHQGFDLNSYDLIIAVNVLHATPNLDVTLQNTRKLMKPGGKLILMEICNTSAHRTGFIFGLLPGWWLGVEDIRRWGAVISEHDWHEALKRNHFSGTDVIFRDHQRESIHVGSAIVSTALEEVHQPSLPKLPHVLILATSGATMQYDTAIKIRTALLSIGIRHCDIMDPNAISRKGLQKQFCVSLLELESPILYDLSDDLFKTLQEMVKSAEALLWITGGGGGFQATPKFDLVTGLSRCIRSEYSRLNFVTLALENTTKRSNNTVQQILKVFKVMNSSDQAVHEKEYVEIEGRLCINRIVEANYLNHDVLSKTTSSEAEVRSLADNQGRALSLTIASPGLLNTIQFVTDDVHGSPLPSGEVEVEVKASGINFRDIAILLGQYPSDYIGIECAGLVTEIGKDIEGSLQIGDRVCGIMRGTYKSYARGKAVLVTKIPDTISVEVAAAAPVAYCTAYHALFHLGQVKEDMSVLIHSAAGGVGQAAIQLLRLIMRSTSHVFVTVGNEQKKRFMMDCYGIPEDNILSSKGPEFAEEVKARTKNRGVDLVLNSLGGEKLRQSLTCVAPFGRFIEIGLKDANSFGSLPTLPFSKSITYSSFDLILMTQETPHILSEILVKVMSLLKDSKIDPGPAHVYSYTKLEDAFRLIQSGKSMGKLVAVPCETDEISVVRENRATYSLDPGSSFLISGGLGGLGRSIARWMVSRGARNLILLSRSGAVDEDSLELLCEMKAKGVKVQTPACDISDEKILAQTLKACETILPPIRGCVQAAMVLKDGIFENMRLADFKAALAPKVQGSWNLHSQLPRGMDFFILLSSLNGILGSRSQSNYGAGNTYEDALARHRVNNGEKAVSLDLGIVSSVGFVAERQEIQSSQLLTGMSAIEEQQLHTILDYHCDPSLPLLSPLKSQVVIGVETPAALRAKGLEDPYWLNQPICRILHQIEADMPNATSATEPQLSLRSLLQSSNSLDAARDVICSALRRKLSGVLSLPVADIDEHSSITSYGTDSLVAVELRNWLLKELGVDVAIFEILSNIGIGKFCEMIAERSSFVNFEAGQTQLKE